MWDHFNKWNREKLIFFYFFFQIFDPLVQKLICQWVYSGDWWKKFQSKIKEKKEAFNENDDAKKKREEKIMKKIKKKLIGISSGKGAYLGTLSNSKFESSVGNFSPNKSVEIIIESEGVKFGPRIISKISKKAQINMEIKMSENIQKFL